MTVRRKNQARKWADKARSATAERNKAIRELHKWHWTTREIGKEVGLSHTAIAKILRK